MLRSAVTAKSTVSRLTNATPGTSGIDPVTTQLMFARPISDSPVWLFESVTESLIGTRPLASVGQPVARFQRSFGNARPIGWGPVDKKVSILYDWPFQIIDQVAV